MRKEPINDQNSIAPPTSWPIGKQTWSRQNSRPFSDNNISDNNFSEYDIADDYISNNNNNIFS